MAATVDVLDVGRRRGRVEDRPAAELMILPADRDGPGAAWVDVLDLALYWGCGDDTAAWSCWLCWFMIHLAGRDAGRLQVLGAVYSPPRRRRGFVAHVLDDDRGTGGWRRDGNQGPSPLEMASP